MTGDRRDVCQLVTFIDQSKDVTRGMFGNGNIAWKPMLIEAEYPLM